MPPILALAVSKVVLRVVIGPPGLMSLLEFRLGARIGKRVVGEPPLDREQGLGIIFPRLPLINPFLADPEHIIKLYGLRTGKNRPTICDDGLRGAIAPKSIG